MGNLWGRAIGGLPGFRTRVWWKRAAAVCVYGVIALVTIAGIPYWSGIFLGLFLLLVALLAGNAWGIRSRLPVLGSHSRRRAAAVGSHFSSVE